MGAGQSNDPTDISALQTKMSADGEESPALLSNEAAAADGGWKLELKAVLSARDIMKPGAKQCQYPECNLVACCIWTCKNDPTDPYYCCLVCQKKDFGGWPTTTKKLPIKTLSRELKRALLAKCTRMADPDMPDIPYEGEATTNEGGSMNGEEGSMVERATSNNEATTKKLLALHLRNSTRKMAAVDIIAPPPGFESIDLDLNFDNISVDTTI